MTNTDLFAQSIVYPLLNPVVQCRRKDKMRHDQRAESTVAVPQMSTSVVLLGERERTLRFAIGMMFSADVGENPKNK